ncbi:MAG TPA: SNF2-related protein, partial [Luteimonas sp.]
MNDAAQVTVDADGESYEVATPAGAVIVTFPLDDELPPTYAGDAAATSYLHDVIRDCVGHTGAALSPQTLTPLALIEIVPSEDDGIKVAAPSDFSEPETRMPALDTARRVIAFPAALLDAVAASKSVADLRSELTGHALGVLGRLEVARALLSRFTGSNPDAGNDPDAGELAPRRATAHFYDYNDDRKPAQRKRENRAAEELLRQIDTGDVDAAALTDEQRAVLAKYSGLGGALLSADGKKGSAYEYYTPKPIAEGIWNLMAELGFTGGKVLDPSAGTGIFGATAPLSAAVDAVELSKVSGRINGLVNGGPGYSATIAPYEKVAAATPDEIYDAVVTNVPFGGVADRGGNNLLDPRYQNEPLQNYFILRTLEKLRPGGLAVFIVPPRCVSGKGSKEVDLRVRASYMAEFLGAYRLPNSVFGTAAADTVTDVIAFRKFSRDVIEKVDELRQQSPQTLIDANVQWEPFTSGRYFIEDGKRFVLGEVQVGQGQWGEVERVVTTQPVGEVAKMLRKFPDSRINWELLDAAPTDPITYRNGDTITQAGQTLEYRDGQWHPLTANAAPVDVRPGDYTDPYVAFEAGVTYQQAVEYRTHMVATAQSLEIPDWVRGGLDQIEKLGSDAERAKVWRAGLVGMAAAYVLRERMSEELGVNYLEEYPDLSDAMQTFAKVAKNRPGGITGALRDGLATITAHVRKDGFSAVWRGDVAAEVEAIDAGKEFSYEGLRYRTKSAWVPMEEARAIFGEDFDPIASEDWCVSADGQSVARAADYYVGNVKDVLDQLDKDIANAANGEIKAKLLWQKSYAATRYAKVNVRELNYGWGSPFVELSEKLEFARRYIHESAYIDTNDKGEQSIKLDLPSSVKETDKGKLMMRVSDYLSRGTVSLASAKFTMKPGDAMKELRRQVATINQQFNGWVRSNHRIMERMQAAANDESKLRFRAIDDETPLQIPGFRQQLHGFQTAFVRKMGREFGGINGFDVGLGKTFTSLASAQYAQAIGVKSKTAFVVPNSVLSNWRKEAGKAYEDTSDCLFIGLRHKRGKDVVDSKYYDEDLQLVLTNKHRKIFMTMEAWERIRMRPETIDAFQRYMGDVDKNFSELDDNKQEEIRKSKVATAFSALRDKVGAAPYLEDMGIDSLVIDEGHGYKNSVSTVDFKSAKFLSLPDPAKRGIDMQAKAWFIRGASPLRDGVLPLTATPITNSPLEIYSMLSLAAGHDRVNDMCLGVKGADDFMEVMTARENIDDVTIDGEERQTDVFTGLNNVNVLRNAISSVATIRNAADVGAQIQLPEGAEKKTAVTLPGDTFDRLRLYKDAFRYAITEMSGGTPDPTKAEAFAQVSEHFNESMGTMSNAFNLINKMELLILDPELDQRASYYSFSKADEAKIAKVVDAFNQKKRIEDRARQNPHTREEAIVGRKSIKDRESGEQKTILRVHVMAYMLGGENRVLIDTLTPALQAEFEDMAEKAGVELDVSMSPKLAALLDNVTAEQATPRGIDDEGNYSPIVKQIIFCDRLGMHNKIKRLLAKRAGIPSSKIAVVTGQTNNEPDQILAVQDGFNAHGEDNKYQIILANEKAEVGINLQKGTQAIHHLTIGWTPDSLTQRNGRGVRQGNKTGVVNVYYYDAEGTFDTYRRGMVNKKADWIETVLDSEGGNSVNVAGGLSDKQYEALVNSLGDSDAMSKIQREIEAAEAAERVVRTRANQVINAETVIKNLRLAQKMGKPADFIKDKLVMLYGLRNE